MLLASSSLASVHVLLILDARWRSRCGLGSFPNLAPDRAWRKTCAHLLPVPSSCISTGRYKTWLRSRPCASPTADGIFSVRQHHGAGHRFPLPWLPRPRPLGLATSGHRTTKPRGIQGHNYLETGLDSRPVSIFNDWFWLMFNGMEGGRRRRMIFDVKFNIPNSAV